MKEPVEIRCPACGSNEVQHIKGDRYVCVTVLAPGLECHHTFLKSESVNSPERRGK